MEWHDFGHVMALAYIRFDLGAVAGQRKAEASGQARRHKQNIRSGRCLAMEGDSAYDRLGLRAVAGQRKAEATEFKLYKPP